MSGEPFHEKQLFSFFFLRRVPAIIWILLLLGLGLVSSKSMVKEALPDLEISQFQITTIWEGANAAMVEKSVTRVIEKSLHGLKGIKKIDSISSDSVSIVIATFRAEATRVECMQLLQQQITTVLGDLPNDMERPKIEAISINDLPVTIVTLSGETDLSELEILAQLLKHRLENVPGIRKINTVGVRKKVVHVQLLPERIKALGISPLQVRSRIMHSGTDASWGTFENTDISFTLKMDGAYSDLSKLSRLFITKTGGGGVIRLGDIAHVRIRYMQEKERAALSWEGEPFIPVVALAVLKASGEDTISLVQQVRRALEGAEKGPDWPQGIQWQLVANEAENIASELDRGMTNGWQATIAVFLVLFVVLTWREALVAALSVPLTLCGVLGILWAFGYTINLLMVVGMVLALGLLVDDFILIMEGMHEAFFVKGLDFTKAVHRTIVTYAIPSFSGSITTILVFAPLAFISGVDGKFIRVIPVTAATCLIVSYIVSVLLGPSLLRFLLQSDVPAKPGMVDRISFSCERMLADWLGRVVVPNKKRSGLWMTAVFTLFCISLIAADTIRWTLYPKGDGRNVGITVELAEGISFEDAEAVADRVGTILRNKSDIEHIFRVVGSGDPYSLQSAVNSNRATPQLIGFGCILVPSNKRDLMGHEFGPLLRAELEEALRFEPGVRVFIKTSDGGPDNEDPLQIAITGSDVDELRKIAEQVKLFFQTIGGVYDIRDTLGPAHSEIKYIPMQEALDHHNLTEEELARQMTVYMLNEKVAKLKFAGVEDDLDIRLGTWWHSRQGEMSGPRDWQELDKLSIVNRNGDAIPLLSLAKPHRVTATPVIRHIDGLRAVTVTAKIQEIYLPELIPLLRPHLDEMKRKWPDGYGYTVLGEDDVDTTFNNMFIAFCCALVLVYAVLALLFDSFYYPGIILSTVLFALVGVFFGFMLFGIPFSFSAIIGIVALVGIVVNDAIIVIITIRNHRRSGATIYAAASKGAADRLRPIVSTTLTNFAGLMPLALSDPEWASICLAIIFGECTATIGAVVLVPAMFVVLTPDLGKSLKKA